MKIEYYKNFSLDDLENEIWKPIIGYEGLYEISNLGRVKSLPKKSKSPTGHPSIRKQMIRKQNYDKAGYLICGLNNECTHKNIKVHRLVAIAFIPNPENKSEVNHKKGIKTDNRDTELEWVNRLENQRHSWDNLNRQSAYKGKLGKYNHLSKKVNQYDLIGNLIKKWDSMADIERQLGFSHGHISKVCRGVYKQCYGFKWEYEK
jgi:hypothetical protein